MKIKHSDYRIFRKYRKVEGTKIIALILPSKNNSRFGMLPPSGPLLQVQKIEVIV